MKWILLSLLFVQPLYSCDVCLGQLNTYMHLYEENLIIEDTNFIAQTQQISYIKGVIQGLKLSSDIIQGQHEDSLIQPDIIDPAKH